MTSTKNRTPIFRSTSTFENTKEMPKTRQKAGFSEAAKNRCWESTSHVSGVPFFSDRINNTLFYLLWPPWHTLNSQRKAMAFKLLLNAGEMTH
ncbi:hypothetical protein ACFX15_001862 [Malus domestica]